MSQAQITELEKKLEKKMQSLAGQKNHVKKTTVNADKLKKLAARLRSYEAESHAHSV